MELHDRSKTHHQVKRLFMHNHLALRPFAGTETVTVSNGDKLVSTIAGAEEALLPLAPPFGLSGSQTITGGTGRFSGATGSLTFTGLDFNDGTASFSTTGTISTVGSSK